MFRGSRPAVSTGRERRTGRPCPRGRGRDSRGQFREGMFAARVEAAHHGAGYGDVDVPDPMPIPVPCLVVAPDRP